MKTRLLALCWVLACGVSAASAQSTSLWLRYPAISPDGQTIAFEHKGDIYSVPAAGGTAVPLTVGESYDFAPVWSHDGKQIAFASDRYGNFDVFVMPASGGEAKRLTFHSAREVPGSFTADDTAVLFSANRQALATNAQFPVSLMTQLYGSRRSCRCRPPMPRSIRPESASSITTSRATKTSGASTTLHL
jgi:tricorn protease